MSKVEEKLIQAIQEKLHALFGVDDPSLVMVEIPKNNSYGDYATNVAMRLAKILHRSPREIAMDLKGELEKETDLIASVSVDGPGFINFRIQTESLSAILNKIFQEGANYGKNTSGAGKRVLVEYVSANPTGNLHLGHARGAVWGDVVTRLLKASGYDCLREYYINDAGAQVLHLAQSLYARYAQHFGQEAEIPQDGYLGEDVKKIALQMAEEEGDLWLQQEEGRLAHFRKRGLEEELKKLQKDLEDFRVSFDSWISEQYLYDSGRVQAAIEALEKSGYTYQADGALWFRSSAFGDDKDRVLRKANGDLTYLTPDIANHLYKLERGYEKLVNLWGADHHGYIPRMQAALQAFGYPKDTLEVDIIQMVRLVENGEEVKMSKRTGNAVTIRELMEDIGVDAARYFFLNRAVDTHFDFDLGLARSKTTENPIYYIQYAHARSAGVKKNAPHFQKQEAYPLLSDRLEVDILKALAAFPNEVAQAAALRAPNRICNYLQQLAGFFHRYYGKIKIVDPDHPQETNERLALVEALSIVLENALGLLGISAPDQM